MHSLFFCLYQLALDIIPLVQTWTKELNYKDDVSDYSWPHLTECDIKGLC